LFRLITTFDEVPPQLSRAQAAPASLHRRSVHRACEIYGVDLKRVPPKSRPAASTNTSHRLASMEPCYMPAARKDSAVHVSLSSDSPVKQPGAHHPLSGRAREPAKQSPSTQADDKSPKVRSFEGRAMPPSGGAPCLSHICSTVGHCQPCILEFFITSSYATATARSGIAASGAASLRDNA
jgi:hypothetical protein